MKRTTIAVASSALLSLGLFACKQAPRAAETAAGAYGAETTTAAGAATGATAMGLPPAVDQAEGLAEDVQTDIEGAKWSDATDKTAKLKALGAALQSAVPGAEWHTAYVRQVDSLQTEVSGHQQVAALQTANRVSRTVTEAMGHFSPKVPVAVSYMDVAGRDLVYAAERGDWATADRALQELKARYGEVAPHVQSADGALAKRIEQELATLTTTTTAHDAAKSAKTARILLEEVDAIERTY